MRASPDRLTKRVLQMLAAARTSSMSREDAIEQAIQSLRRNLRYLARREQRCRQTSYDEVLEGDLEAIARLIVLLEPSSEASPDGGSGSCFSLESEAASGRPLRLKAKTPSRA